MCRLGATLALARVAPPHWFLQAFGPNKIFLEIFAKYHPATSLQWSKAISVKPLTGGFVCLPKNHKNWCLALLFYILSCCCFFLCFWFCAGFVLFRGGCLLLNAVILVAHISAAKYKVEVSAFRVHCLGLCFFVLPTHRTLTSYAKPKMMHNALISLSAFAWIVRRRSCLCSVGFGALLNSTSFKSSYSMSMSIARISARFLAYPCRILITNTIMHPWSLQTKQEQLRVFLVGGQLSGEQQKRKIKEIKRCYKKDRRWNARKRLTKTHQPPPTQRTKKRC